MFFIIGEANGSMRERIDGFMRRRLDTTSKQLKNTAQQMATSQTIIQVCQSSLLWRNKLYK